MLTTLVLNEDIIVEILTRLPAKEIAKLRCVCKRWLSLASEPRFIQYHNARNPHPSTSGFFLHDHKQRASYFPLNLKPPGLPDPSFTFIPTSSDRDQINIESSCNGLILCRLIIISEVVKYVHYVCNPTTREFVEVPIPKDVGRNFSLAFDPSKSPHYKVVSIGSQIHVYSSATRSWNLSIDKESLREYGGPHGIHSYGSVLWNGALIWIGMECLLSFDVEGEYLKKLPMPPEPHKFLRVLYIGESRGKLQMIGKVKNEQISTAFDILEMDSPCSGWSVLHHVDLDPIKDLYPEIQEIRMVCMSGFAGSNRNITPPKIFQGFFPVYFMRGGEEGRGEEGTLLLSVPRKIISYDLRSKAFGTVCEVLYSQPYEWYRMHTFGHTFFSP